MFPFKHFLLLFTGDVSAWIIRVNAIWGERRGGWKQGRAGIHAHRGECWLHQSCLTMNSLRYPAALSASLTPHQDRLLFLTGGSRWPGIAPHLRGLFPHMSVFLQAAARFLSEADLRSCGHCQLYLFPLACKVHGCRWVVQHHGQSLRQVRGLLLAVWIPPPTLIIITDVRRGRNIQLDQQRPQTAAETTQLTVRLTLRVRGYGYCISNTRALHTVLLLLVCVVKMFHEVGFNHSYILDRKVLFLFSESHFCHCCGSGEKWKYSQITSWQLTQ